MLVENPYVEWSLSDMLDRWRSYVIDAGADTAGEIGPGLSDGEIRQMESQVGFEFVPQAVEFLSWGVCIDKNGSRFFPMSAELTPLRYVVQNTRGLPESWGADQIDALVSDDCLLPLWGGDMLFVVDNDQDSPTCGGLLCLDDGTHHWAAKDLRGLVSACLRLADHDLLVMAGDRSEGDPLYLTPDHDRVVAFGAELAARFAETSPADHPIRRLRSGFASQLTYRWEVVDNPELWTWTLEWVW